MKRDKYYLHNMYNATSTDDPPGSDELETYEAWLERQLLSRIEKIEKLEDLLSNMWKAIGDFCKSINELKNET